MNTSTLVQKLWNDLNVLRDTGMRSPVRRPDR